MVRAGAEAGGEKVDKNQEREQDVKVKRNFFLIFFLMAKQFV